MGVELMTKKDITDEINQLSTRIKELKQELQKRRDESKVPQTLDWKNGEECYYVHAYKKDIEKYIYDRTDDFITSKSKNHTIFKTREYAEMFLDKIQYVADLLHFKWLYDRDYKLNWNSFREKYYVYYDCDTETFRIDCGCNTKHKDTVYFSDIFVAQKCADWLNDKHCPKKEQ